MIDELREMARTPSIQSRHIRIPASSEAGLKGYVFSGDFGNDGQAYGIARVVQSVEELSKVSEGEIVITQFYETEMIETFKKVAAAVGTYSCGGRMGHLAIVSRGLGIPCVLRVDERILGVDGKIVLVDGDSKEVKVLN
jgi:phosphoenolpyruvate synthase/pyruvate phosphate dikinase